MKIKIIRALATVAVLTLGIGTAYVIGMVTPPNPAHSEDVTPTVTITADPTPTPTAAPEIGEPYSTTAPAPETPDWTVAPCENWVDPSYQPPAYTYTDRCWTPDGISYDGVPNAGPENPNSLDTDTITEDDPRWDCRSMGNQTCGVCIQHMTYLVTFEDYSPTGIRVAPGTDISC